MRVAAAILLLSLPTVLAFFSGGFFDGPRLVAGVAVWLAFAAIAVTSPQPLPRTTPGRLALAGLAGLTCWTTASIAWAPLADAATSDAQRMWLYLGVFACAAALLREPRLARAVEPALAAGAAIVIGYALLTRLLPGVFPIEHSTSAQGRLEQPLTYWNALGALAAVGLVLALRLASDATRPVALQAAAASVQPGLVLALFLTVSRGALAAAVAGVVALLLLAPGRRTLHAMLLAAVSGGLLTLLAFRFPAIENLQGDAADRRLQGLGVLVLLVAAGGAAALVQRGILRGRRRAVGMAAVALVVTAVTLVAAAGVPEPVPAPPRATPSTGPAGAAISPGTERLRSVKSNRYSYWKVALRGFGDRPFVGGGAHSFAVLWLRERTIAEPVQDAHSLYLETLTELGLVGALLLALFLGGAIACAVAVWRAGPSGRTLGTGWLAAGVVLLAHAGLDWDWEMPALALILVILAGAAVAGRGPRGSRMTGVPRPTRAFLLPLLGVAAVGLAIRGYYVEQVASGLDIKGDAYTYHWLANLIADGKGFTSPWKYILAGVDEATAEHPPLYPLYLSGFSWLGLDSVGNHRLASSLLGCGTVVAVGFLGRRVAGDRAGLAAAAVAAVYPLMVVTDGIVHSESLYGLLIALSLIAAYRFRESPGPRRAALLGAAIGAAALTRSEALLLLPLLVFPLSWRAGGPRLRNAAIACVAFALVISPWVVRSWIVFDRPVGLSNNLGGLLAGANCERTYHGDFTGLWRFDCLGPADGDEAERAAVYRREGLEYARDHLGRLLVVAPIRVLRSFDLYRPNQQATYEAFAEDRDLTWQRAGIAIYYCLLALGAYGVVLLRRRGEPLLVLLAPFAMVVVVSLVGYGITRLRYAAEIPLVVLAGVALAALAERLAPR